MRRRGRPRKRWKEEVERDLQVLGVRLWTDLVADREKWKETVQQAKAHIGLKCQWKKKNMMHKRSDNRYYSAELSLASKINSLCF